MSYLTESWPPPGSFADRMLQRQSFRLSDLAKEVQYLDVEHLDFLLMTSAAHLMKKYREPDYTSVEYQLATDLLVFFLGLEWVLEHVIYDHAASVRNKLGRRFLNTDTVGKARLRHAFRVTSMAECLYNLQRVPGMEYRLSGLARDDLEAAIGELESAKLLAHPQHKLRFITPVSKKGCDYDAEITTNAGVTVCAEMKTKKESEVYADTTVRNTLEHARKQLPKGKPGIILLKYPSDWIKNKRLDRLAKDAINKTLRQSDRLVAIITHWEKWSDWEKRSDESWGRSMQSYVMPDLNYDSNLLTQDIRESLKTLGVARNPGWLQIQQFTTERLPAVVSYANRLLFTEYVDPVLRPDSQGLRELYP